MRPVCGFTLIELLAVLATIAVLSAFVFGLGRYVSESGRISRAHAELAVMVAALENYQRLRGDYPRTDDAALMLQALLGRRDPQMRVSRGRVVLELTHLTMEGEGDPYADETVRLVDPWGRPYRYAYRNITPWNNPRYVLYSAGPDGVADEHLSPGGFPDANTGENRDNLHAHF